MRVHRLTCALDLLGGCTSERRDPDQRDLQALTFGRGSVEGWFARCGHGCAPVH